MLNERYGLLGFAMLGPTSIATIGRKPATTRGLMGAHVIPEFG